MIVIKLAHPSAFVLLIFGEILFLCEFEGLFVKYLLELVGPFLLFVVLLDDLFVDKPVVLRDLLKFHISKLLIIQILVQDDIDIWQLLFNLLLSLFLVGGWSEFFFKHSEVLSTAHDFQSILC